VHKKCTPFCTPRQYRLLSLPRTSFGRKLIEVNGYHC